jgi:hypothetical protein
LAPFLANQQQPELRRLQVKVEYHGDHACVNGKMLEFEHAGAIMQLASYCGRVEFSEVPEVALGLLILTGPGLGEDTRSVYVKLDVPGSVGTCRIVKRGDSYGGLFATHDGKLGFTQACGRTGDVPADCVDVLVNALKRKHDIVLEMSTIDACSILKKFSTENIPALVNVAINPTMEPAAWFCPMQEGVQ